MTITINTENLVRETGVDHLEALPRDVSPRHYYRGRKNGRDVIVMLYPDADEVSQKELANFIDIGASLEAQGIKTPSTYGSNQEKCYAVLEDLGTRSYGDCLRQGIMRAEDIYQAGTDVLIRLRDVTDVNGLPLYKDSGIYQKRRQLVDYYMSLKRGAHAGEQTVQSFLSVWDEIEQSLPPCPLGFVHGDYHLENLMYVGAEQGIRQCALIDYQDALHGPLPYDLVNLLEDARVDIPDDIHQAMIDRYCAGMSAEEKDVFLQWFRVLAAQFHGRVIGLFIKLAAEQDRDSYLVHIPRLQNYLKKSLNDPVLAPLKAWFDKEGLDLEAINDLDGNHIRNIFRNIEF